MSARLLGRDNYPVLSCFIGNKVFTSYFLEEAYEVVLILSASSEMLVGRR